MRGLGQSTGVIAVSALASLILPPLSFISGAALGLVTLRQGSKNGAMVLVVSALITSVFALMLTGSVIPAAVYTVILWLPVWLLSLVLRVTASQGLSLALIGVSAAVVLMGMHVLIDDMAGWWRALLDETLQQRLLKSGLVADVEILNRALSLMNGLVVGSFASTLMITLLIARWWQAMLYNAGKFKSEFQALRIPRWYLGLTVLVIIAAIGTQAGYGSLLVDLLIVACFVLMYQGLALGHWLVGHRRISFGWLIAMYVLMILLPVQCVILLAGLGMIDGWVDFRRYDNSQPT